MSGTPSSPRPPPPSSEPFASLITDDYASPTRWTTAHRRRARWTTTHRAARSDPRTPDSSSVEPCAPRAGTRCGRLRKFDVLLSDSQLLHRAVPSASTHRWRLRAGVRVGPQSRTSRVALESRSRRTRKLAGGLGRARGGRPTNSSPRVCTRTVSAVRTYLLIEEDGVPRAPLRSLAASYDPTRRRPPLPHPAPHPSSRSPPYDCDKVCQIDRASRCVAFRSSCYVTRCVPLCATTRPIWRPGSTLGNPPPFRSPARDITPSRGSTY
ncbi:hypothetical protein B0H12DRAFT_95182 [Mycena haematopus]|nr:hypothetical protein B0H12DRAFT_95182 [Mycena haematopus]